jgi:hypothetical protein
MLAGNRNAGASYGRRGGPNPPCRSAPDSPLMNERRAVSPGSISIASIWESARSRLLVIGRRSRPAQTGTTERSGDRCGAGEGKRLAWSALSGSAFLLVAWRGRWQNCPLDQMEIKARPYAGWAPPCAGWRTRVAAGSDVRRAGVGGTAGVAPTDSDLRGRAACVSRVATRHGLPVRAGADRSLGVPIGKSLDCLWAGAGSNGYACQAAMSH